MGEAKVGTPFSHDYPDGHNILLSMTLGMLAHGQPHCLTLRHTPVTAASEDTGENTVSVPTFRERLFSKHISHLPRVPRQCYFQELDVFPTLSSMCCFLRASASHWRNS